MPAYAIAHLRNLRPHPDLVEYLERIQSTLDPYSGRFLVHGGGVDVREGAWPGTVVVIEFPGLAEARAWYESAPYREILPLRTGVVDADLILVEGVGPGYDPAGLAAIMSRELGP